MSIFFKSTTGGGTAAFNSTSQLGTVVLGQGIVSSYPQSAVTMTSNTTTVNGLTYTASQSSYLPIWNSYGYMAFNKDDNNGTVQFMTNYIAALGGSYGQAPYTSAGVYQGGTNGSTVSNYYSTTVGGVGVVNGEWLQIQLPYTILITGFNISPNTTISIMNAGYLIGSNDGTTWTNLYTLSSSISTNTTFNVTTSTAYSYYRLIFTGLSNTSTYFGASLGELSFNGTLTNAPTSMSAVNNIVSNGTINGTNMNALGTLNAGNLIVSNQATVNGLLQTQGMVVEQLNPITVVSTNTFSVNFSAGGIYFIPLVNSPTANMSLTITNIPSMNASIASETITVAYYQTTSRYYINQVKMTDTLGNYFIGSAGAYGTPLYNGGVPSLTAGTPCLILQQFTHMPFWASPTTTRYITTSINCCS